jgi:hypothetical protein
MTVIVQPLNQNELVDHTLDDLTYYVTAAGSDSTGNGSSGAPWKTIQYAVNQIPKNIEHNVIIDVGAGTFAGFRVTGFTVQDQASFIIRGTTSAFSPATGTASGTFTSSTHSATAAKATATDSGQSWTVDNLKGKLLKIGSEYRWIVSNTATVITYAGAFSATPNGKAYEIIKQDTILGTFPGTHRYGYIEMSGNNFGGPVEVAYAASSGCVIQDFECDGQGGYYEGAWLENTSAPHFIRLKSDTPYWGIGGQNLSGTFICDTVWVNDSYNSASGSIYLIGAPEAKINNCYVEDGNNPAFHFADVQAATASNCYAKGSAIGYSFLGCMIGNLYYSESDTCTTGLMAMATQFLDPIACTFSGGTTGVALNGVLSCIFDVVTISSNSGWGVISSMKHPISGGTENLAPSNLSFSDDGATISSNGSGGILLKNKSFARLDDVSGSNTGAYGVKLETGSSATITEETEITGATNDMLIDTTAASYAGDFASNGSVVSDAATFCSVVRED